MAANSVMDTVTDIAAWPDDMVSFSTMSPSTTVKIDFFPIRFGYFVGMGIIMPIGFIFNTLSAVVLLTSRSLRSSTTGLYLIALALADNLFLVGEFFRWLDTDDHIPSYTFLATSEAWCQFVFCLRYGSKLTSAWITVAITAERFFIIAFPLKAITICTRQLAKIAICVIYIICFILGCFPVFAVGLDTYAGEVGCFIVDHQWYSYGNWVVLRVGSLLLPALIIIILTTLILINLTRAKFVRRQTLTESQVISERSGSNLRHVEKQLTIMLLAVAIAFIILRTPYTILFHINTYKRTIWAHSQDAYFFYQIYVATKLADLFAGINYAINFFLYSLTGSTFRSQLKNMFCCQKKQYPGRKLSTSAVTHNTVVNNEKIPLALMTRANNGHGLNMEHNENETKHGEMDSLQSTRHMGKLHD